MPRFLFVLFFCLAYFEAQAAISTKNAFNIEELKNNLCQKEQKELFKQWNDVDRKWIGQLKSDGSMSFYKPTSEMSVWIAVEKKGEELYFSRHTPQSIIEVTFDNNCKKSLKVLKDEIIDYKNIPPQFVTDPKLFSIIAKYQNGIIYHFSPRMNLSIQGLKNIIQVSQKLKKPLLILMDKEAQSEVNKVKKMFEKEKIDAGEILLSHSLELFLRRTYIHYPNMLLFKNGAILDDFYPGLYSESDYESVIKSRI